MNSQLILKLKMLDKQVGMFFMPFLQRAVSVFGPLNDYMKHIKLACKGLFLSRKINKAKCVGVGTLLHDYLRGNST